MTTTAARFIRVAVVAISLLAIPASPGSGQVIAGPEGPVEFVGLQRWSAQELFDAIRETAPGRPFHACAAVMRFDLGFAEAAAMSFRTRDSGEPYTVVVGVEDSARVRYRPTGAEVMALPESWQRLKALADADMRVLDVAARTMHSRSGFLNRIIKPAKRLAADWGASSEAVDEALDLVDSANREEDRLLAHEVLARDSTWTARAVASLVLGNFPDHDSSWHALAGSLTDSHARVGSLADHVVTEFLAKKRRPVDWSGARESLAALFDGTSPFIFRNLLTVLRLTEIDPELGRQLARRSPDLLLAHAAAEHEYTRDGALTFLRTVSGEDFGRDADAWATWLNGLSFLSCIPCGTE